MYIRSLAVASFVLLLVLATAGAEDVYIPRQLCGTLPLHIHTWQEHLP
jgi:hypothetical protein